jgi:hypothetical protein
MDREEIRRRIAEIRTELVDIRTALTGRTAELDELIAQLGDDDGGGGRPILTLIKGGLGGLIMPTVLTRRPRHPVATAGTAAVAGAIAAVLLVPAHTTNGGGGAVMSYISIPAEPLVSPTGHGWPPSAAPMPNVATPRPAAPTRAPRGLPTPPQPATPTAMPTAPATVPAPSTAVPTAGASASAIPSGSVGASPRRCVLRVTVTGIVEVCVG